MSAKASTSVTLPPRIDFTSDPASTMPASSVSSTWYSCRARRFLASTLGGWSFCGLEAGFCPWGLAIERARSLHCPGQGEHLHRTRARREQRARALAEGGAGGEDVVDQQDAPPPHRRARRHRE